MKIRVFEAFAGYGSQSIALEKIKQEYSNFDYEVVGISEIDKYAIKAYNALHNNVINYGDIAAIDWNGVPDFDLFTYSFPCQDISSAGYQKGFCEGSATRSSLLWECRKAIVTKRPKYLLLENVKALSNKKFRPLLNKWIEELESYGYYNAWKVLNARDFGVPQNRERLFLVSILKDEATTTPIYNFPPPIPLDIRLVDMLENSDAIKCSKQIEVLEPAIKIDGYLFPSRHSAGRIINIGGISPTVMENHGSVISIKEPYSNIRKLTPREYFRLMGLCDDDIDKIESHGICKSQQYKLAGNSIVVNVLYHIFLSLFACSLEK